MSSPSSVCAVSCTSTSVTSSAAPVRKLAASEAKNGPFSTPDMSTSLVFERSSHTTNRTAATTPAAMAGTPHEGSTALSGSGL